MPEPMLSRGRGALCREIRFDAEDEEDLRILDGYNAATGETVKGLMSELLHQWAVKKKHEATLVLRFAKSIPGVSESERNGSE